MSKCYQVDLRINGGYSLLLVFAAMKKMQQESSLIDESVTISYDEKTKLTAGFYDDVEAFYDLLTAVMWKDMDMIKSHIKNDFPSDLDPEIKKLAINNICESLRLNHKDLSLEEKEELIKLIYVKRR